VAQAFPPLRQVIYRFWQFLDAFFDAPALKPVSRRLARSKGWLLGFSGLVLLLLWQWQLVVSGGIGLAAMLTVYLVMQGQWQLPNINWQRFWSRSSRPLTLAGVAGGVVWFCTYCTIALWQETGGSWFAKSMILEGFGLLAVLGLLGWQLSRHPADRTHPSAELNLLADLSHSDPVQRLIAIRRIAQQMTQQMTQPITAETSLHADRIDHPDRRTENRKEHSLKEPLSLGLSPAHLADCFRLMLDRETEPIVCRALVESLQALNQLSRAQSPSSQPRQLQDSHTVPFAPKTSEKTQVE
jgi:hypothetical protein